MKKILVSECLYGGRIVRYDGKALEETDARFVRWKEEGRLIPFCTEVFGGLTIPRTPAQRVEHVQGFTEYEDFDEYVKVMTEGGEDVTAAYVKGATEAVRLAIQNQVVCCIMKQNSPACGSHSIYDGTFSHRKIKGEGVATEFLRKAGFVVFGEDELDEVEGYLDSLL